MKLLVIFSLILTAGCAYDIGHKQRSLPGGHRTIFISQFSNQTQSVGAEAYFTNAMIGEMERSGFAVVTSKEQAELVLTGKILTIDYIGIASETDFQNFQGNPIKSTLFTRYRLDAIALIEVKKTVDNSVVWQQTIRGSKNFLSPKLTKPGIRTSNPLYNQSTKDDNVRLVAIDMMNEAFDQLTENF